MNPYQSILLVADPAMRQTPALRRAAHLARATGAELHIRLFDYSGAVAALGSMSRKLGDAARWGFVEQRERWLRELADSLSASGVDVDTRMVWGTPASENIVDAVVELDPDIVVKDIHLEPLLKRVVVTPLDWQLLRLCPAPLLLVNAAARNVPRRVIAAVDTAHLLKGAEGLNDRIVTAAAVLARQCDASLQLVHAFEELLPLLPGEVVTPAVFGDVYKELRDLHRKQFETFAGRHGIPPERRHFVSGPPAVSLPVFAEDSETDVLVLGTTYRSGMGRIALGSAAESILGHVRCDVLVIKPEGFMNDLARHFHVDKAKREVDKALAEPVEFSVR